MTLSKIDIKSTLVGAVATLLVMAIAILPYLFIKSVVEADKREQQGQKAMIEKHKLENKGVL